MPSNDDLMDTRLAAVRQLATLPDGAFNPDGLAWAAAYRQDVTALRARLTTAEQERDELHKALNTERVKWEAAEARVEAAEQALAWIAEEADRAIQDRLMPQMTLIRLRDRALGFGVAWKPRAALACPPQQTEGRP